MLEQQQRQIEEQKRQEEIKRQQEALRLQREQEMSQAAPNMGGGTHVMANMMQMYQQMNQQMANPMAKVYNAQAAAVGSGLGVAQQELLRQQQAKMANQMQQAQLQAAKNIQAIQAQQAAKPAAAGHMARMTASAAAATAARDSRAPPQTAGRDSRSAPSGSYGARPGLGADERPSGSKRGDDRERPHLSSPRVAPRDDRRRDSNRGKYMVKVSPFPFTTLERDYQQLRLRYPNLHVAPDFCKVKCLWPDGSSSEDALTFPLENSVHFWCGDKDKKHPEMLRRYTAEASPKSSTSAPKKFNAKVMMVQGLPKTWLKDLEEKHITKLIKFLCIKSSKHGLMCVGGMWQKELDGGKEGAPGHAALIKTAIRCVKDTIDLDLSAVKKWHRFMEITYHRPAETYKGSFYPEQSETTVIFLPELEDAMPSASEYSARITQWKGELDAKALKQWEEEIEKRNAAKREAQEKLKKAKDAAMEAARLKLAALEAAKQAAKAAAEVSGKEVPASPPGEPEEEPEEAVKMEEDKTDDGPDPEKPEPVVIEGLPEEACLVPRPRWTEGDDKGKQFKCMILSLDGLLDYNLDDDKEKNFEISLFAELFHEMLATRYCRSIISQLEQTAKEEVALKAERDKKREEERLKSDNEKEARGKRPADDGDEKADGGEKRAKTEVTGFVKAETLNAEVKDEKTEAVTAADVKAWAADAAANKGAAPAETAKANQEPCGEEEFVLVQSKTEIDQQEVFHVEKVMHPELHPAWLFFDRGYADYVRAEDVEVMLHNLGTNLSLRQVEGLVGWSCSSRRIHYRTWSVSHKPVFDGIKPVAPADGKSAADEQAADKPAEHASATPADVKAETAPAPAGTVDA